MTLFALSNFVDGAKAIDADDGKGAPEKAWGDEMRQQTLENAYRKRRFLVRHRLAMTAVLESRPYSDLP